MSEKYNLTHSQKRIYMAQEYFNNNVVWNTIGIAAFNEDINVNNFKKALEYIIKENTIFHIRFTEDNGAENKYCVSLIILE